MIEADFKVTSLTSKIDDFLGVAHDWREREVVVKELTPLHEHVRDVSRRSVQIDVDSRGNESRIWQLQTGLGDTGHGHTWKLSGLRRRSIRTRALAKRRLYARAIMQNNFASWE